MLRGGGDWVIDIADARDPVDEKARRWMDDTNSIVSADGLRVLARRDAVVDEAKIEQIRQIQAAMKKQTSDGGKSHVSRISAFAATGHGPGPGLTPEEQQRIAADVTQRVLADRRKREEYSTFYQEELREAQNRTDAAFGGNVPPSPREPVYRPGDDAQHARMAQMTNLARQQVTLEEQQIIESITAVIGMTAQIVESGAQALDFHMIETQDLSVEVRRAIDNEEFSIALRHMLQQGGGELFKNPYISIGTLIMSLVMKNHGRITNAKASGRTPARLKHDAEELLRKKEEKLERRRQREAERQRRIAAEEERAAAPSIEQKLNSRIDDVAKSIRTDMSSLIASVNALIEQRSRNGSRRGSDRDDDDDASSSASSRSSRTSRRERKASPAPAPIQIPPPPLSEAPTVEDRSDAESAAGSDAGSDSSIVPDDQLITVPSDATGGAFAKIIGGVAPIVEQFNESGKREEKLNDEANDLKERMRRLNLKF